MAKKVHFLYSSLVRFIFQRIARVVARSKLPDSRIYHFRMKQKVQFHRRIVAASFCVWRCCWRFLAFLAIPFLATIAHLQDKIENRIKEGKLREDDWERKRQIEAEIGDERQ